MSMEPGCYTKEVKPVGNSNRAYDAICDGVFEQICISMPKFLCLLAPSSLSMFPHREPMDL